MVVKIIQQIFLSHNKEDDDAGKKIGENSSVSGKQNQTDFFIHNKDDDAGKKIGENSSVSGKQNQIDFFIHNKEDDAGKKIGGSTNKNTHNKDDDAEKKIGGSTNKISFLVGSSWYRTPSSATFFCTQLNQHAEIL